MNKNGGRWVYSYRHDDRNNYFYKDYLIQLSICFFIFIVLFRNGSETLEMLWKFLVLGLIGENGPASVHNQVNYCT